MKQAGNVNRRIISTDLDPVDFHDNVPVDVASAHQPIGNLDRDDLLDAGQRLQETQIDLFFVSDDPNNVLEFPKHRVRFQTLRADRF